jgi:hypothetical protein
VTTAQVTRAQPVVPVRRRPSTWLAVAVLATILAMIGATFALRVLPGAGRVSDRSDIAGLFAPANIPLLLGVLLASPMVGAILAIRRPRNPIGWLFLVIALGLTLSVFSSLYVGRSVAFGFNLPADRFVDWIGSLGSTVASLLAVTWIPLLFPDGRLPGPRWRPFAWLAALGNAGVIAAAALTVDGMLPNPIAVQGLPIEIAAGVAGAMTGFGIGLAVASVVVRFRRSRGVERQQLKWFVAAASFLGVAIPITSGYQVEWGTYLLEIGLILLPIAVGIAILRYRLYEIDRLISRTIGWALVTGILAAVFVGVVLALQALLAGFTQGETLAVAASTLAAFALFQPLRRRIQVAVDRRFDRARYDGQQLAGAFGERLRDEVDLEGIRADIPVTVDAAVRPTHVGLWLRERQAAGR